MKLPDYKEARKRTNSTVEKEIYELDSSISNIGAGKKYYIKTYGCQMNEHDTENIKAMLEQLGFAEVDDYINADLVLLNTCSIRENAHNKAFGMLGRLKHLKEEKRELIVGLCGCMAQEEKVVDEIMHKYKWVNFVFGTHNIHRLPYILNESFNSMKQEIEVYSKEGNIVEGMPVKRASKYKAYVNIMYGCDKFCTYCIVPYTRGKQRSREKDDIIEEVLKLKEEGYQEVTLLGQNVNAYGKDFSYNYNLENLLEDVSKTNIPRVRFMTSHPWDFTDGMIEVIKKYPNIMPAIHLPVQSGSSKILKLMGRKYTKEEYIELFDKLKTIPNVSISTDIIVGFPNESDEDFKETLDLVNYCKYDNAFTFIFSPRVGTPAAKLEDKITLEEKEQRLYLLNETVNKYFLENNKKLVGQKVKVLTEGTSEKEGMLFGYTETNKLINFVGTDDLIGKIIDIEVTDAKTWSLDGKVC
ncbi:MAG: tRNA (N6-isopentenyl adenosine(37)-C2)-methylthiotransferase MiaB [Bacilli bacterium]|nr:tRNA (N6-isopentenyl adenosine(37)-C2)-methylthiotransferase MiaB [Bacilli bacterium]